LKTTGGAVENNRNKNKSNRINQIKGKEREAAVPCEHLSEPSKTAALAAAISLLKNFSQDEIQQLLQAVEHSDHLEERSPTESVSPSQQASDVLENMPPAPTVEPESKQAEKATNTEQATQTGGELQRPASPARGNEHGSKQAEITDVSEQAPQTGDELQRPASDAALTEEVAVQLWEHLRGLAYTDKEERVAQLRAVNALLKMQLPLPLSVDLLEQVYVTYYDNFWRSKFGELHLSHLVETERSSGQRRIVRWLNRLRSQVAGPTVSTAEPARQVVISASSTPPVRMIEWKGRLIPEEQAYREGYNGGFERFLDGDDPNDDLEALVKKFQAEGKIKMPILASAS
jgi:hypothetical protein